MDGNNENAASGGGEDSASLDAILEEEAAKYGDEGAPSDGEPAPESGDEADAEAESGGKAEEAASGSEAESGGEAQETVEPPADWPDQDKERFKQLPRQAQDLALEQYKRMQADYTRKTQALAENDKFARTLKDEVIDDEVKQDLHANGMDEVQGIRQMVALHKFAKRDPAGYARWIIQQSGLDPEAVVDGTDQQPEQAQQQTQQQADPRIDQMQQQLQTLTQTEQQRQEQQIQAQIDEFRNAKDENGEPLRPHFDEVQGQMAQLIQYGLASDLTDAYDKAVWQDPNIRQKQLSRAQAAQADNEQRQQAAAKARRAGRVPRGQPAAPETSQASGNLDDILAEEINRNI